MRQTPQHHSYDVVIVGGAIYGSAIACFLARHPAFDGRILVVERDPAYAQASTSHTNSCIRQQFTAPINVRMSQFGAAFIKTFRDWAGVDDAPDLTLQSFGYLYLADTPAFADSLRAAQQVQAGLGAATRHMSAAQIKAAYPFYNLDDILAGNHNLVDEGYFDGGTMFDWFRRLARSQDVDYIHNQVVAMDRQGARIHSVTLASGERIACGTVVNASGPRAVLTARMAGLDLPVEPRKRFTFIFDAAEKLGQVLPLTIDPSGVHMRSDGAYYMAGCPPDHDIAVDYDDFTDDPGIWEGKVWPVLAHRVPAFERIKLINAWVGHYAYNTLDQNALVGPHPDVPNFILANGFSGHGLQHAPAIGRGLAEWIALGHYDSLDLSPLHADRLQAGTLLTEKAVI